MKLIKRIKINKKEFLKNLGYKETDNLMANRIFNFEKYNKKYMFECINKYGEK